MLVERQDYRLQTTDYSSRTSYTTNAGRYPGIDPHPHPRQPTHLFLLSLGFPSDVGGLGPALAPLAAVLAAVLASVTMTSSSAAFVGVGDTKAASVV